VLTEHRSIVVTDGSIDGDDEGNHTQPVTDAVVLTSGE
jgi:hypothetical protein